MRSFSTLGVSHKLIQFSCRNLIRNAFPISSENCFSNIFSAFPLLVVAAVTNSFVVYGFVWVNVSTACGADVFVHRFCLLFGQALYYPKGVHQPKFLNIKVAIAIAISILIRLTLIPPRIVHYSTLYLLSTLLQSR